MVVRHCPRLFATGCCHGCCQRALMVCLEPRALLPQPELTALRHDQAIYPLTHTARRHIPLIHALFSCSVEHHTVCPFRCRVRGVRDQRIQVANGVRHYHVARWPRDFPMHSPVGCLGCHKFGRAQNAKAPEPSILKQRQAVIRLEQRAIGCREGRLELAFYLRYCLFRRRWTKGKCARRQVSASIDDEHLLATIKQPSQGRDSSKPSMRRSWTGIIVSRVELISHERLLSLAHHIMHMKQGGWSEEADFKTASLRSRSFTNVHKAQILASWSLAKFMVVRHRSPALASKLASTP